MDILKKIPEEHILARTRDSNYPELPDVEYPSATYPPLENYKLGPEDFCWIKLEDEYVYVPRAYDPNRDESWFNQLEPLRTFCNYLSKFLPGQPRPEIEGKLVSTEGEPIPYRVCVNIYKHLISCCLPLVKIERVVFKPGSIATVILNPEHYLLLSYEEVMSNVVKVVTKWDEPMYLSYPRQTKGSFVINGEDDPNLVRCEGRLSNLTYYDWKPGQIIDLNQKDRVYISVKDKQTIDLIEEMLTWIKSSPRPKKLESLLQRIIRQGVANKVIPWLRQFSPLEGELVLFFDSCVPNVPYTRLKFPMIKQLKVDVLYSDFPHIMVLCESYSKRITWIFYLDPKLTNNLEFLIEKLLLKPMERCVKDEGLTAHLTSTLVWLCERKAPLELALKAWEEIIQSADPKVPEQFQTQSMVAFEKVWKKLTQESSTE